MFDTIFDNGEWHHVEEHDTYTIVEYTGTQSADSQNYDIAIQFRNYTDNEEFEVYSITVDGRELDAFDSNLFLENVFTEYDGADYGIKISR